VTGGKLVEEKRTNAENLSGTGSGRVFQEGRKGRRILVPAGVPISILPWT